MNDSRAPAADVPMDGVPAGRGEARRLGIGVVREGQEVAVKFDAFPFTRYGLLKGHVRNLGRDAVQTGQVTGACVAAPTGIAELRAKITLDQDWIGVAGRHEPVQAGMRSRPRSRPGDRKALDYPLSPGDAGGKGSGEGAVSVCAVLDTSRAKGAICGCSVALLLTIAPHQSLAGAGASKTGTLLFSADDKLCKSLEAHLKNLHRRYPKAVYLSDIQESFWKKVLFERPHWISNPNPNTDPFYASLKLRPVEAVSDFINKKTGDIPQADALIFDRVTEIETKSLVRVHNSEFSMRGDYTTDAYFFRPGFSFADSPSSVRRGPNWETSADYSPQILGLKVPYDLKPLHVHIDKNKELNTRVQDLLDVLHRNLLSQFPFLYNGRIQILTGYPLSAAWVTYQLSSTGNLNLLCMGN